MTAAQDQAGQSGLRLERRVTGGSRIALVVVGGLLLAVPWVGELASGGATTLPGLLLLLAPTTIALLLWAGAVAGRGTVTTVEGKALVVERLASPLLPSRVDRYLEAGVDGIEVVEEYNDEATAGQHDYTWRLDAHLQGRRRPLLVLAAAPDRRAVERSAAQLRAALQLADPLPPVELTAPAPRRARWMLAAWIVPCWLAAGLLLSHWYGQPMSAAWPAAAGVAILAFVGLLAPLVALGARGTAVTVRPSARRITIHRGLTSVGRRHEVLRFAEVQRVELLTPSRTAPLPGSHVAPRTRHPLASIDLIVGPRDRRVTAHRSVDAARTEALHRDLLAALGRHG